jgi:hypothetical protein
LTFTDDVLSLDASTEDHVLTCLTPARLPDAVLLLVSADPAVLPEEVEAEETALDTVCLTEAGALETAEEMAAEAAVAAATVFSSLEMLKLIPALGTVETGADVTCVSDAMVLATALDVEETSRAAALSADGDAGVPELISLLTA